MSFIFEALKRAEEDRRRGDVPLLGAVLHGGPGPQRSRWPWIAVAVGLAANAAVLGGWLWTRSLGPLGGEASRPAAASAAPAKVVAEVERRAEPPRTTPQVLEPEPRVLARVLPVVERSGEPSVSPSVAMKPEPEGSDRKRPAVAPTVSVPSVSPGAALVRGASAPTPSSVHEAVAPVTPVARPDPAPLQDLPAGVRTRLARIRVDGHVYRDDPADSFVFIDNHIYHVGDTIGVDGPRIETITPTGLVVDYGEGRAILAASGQ